MQLVLAILVFGFVSVFGQNSYAAGLDDILARGINNCSSYEAAQTKLETAVRAAKMSSGGSSFEAQLGNWLKDANKCAQGNDTAMDEDDLFSCEDIDAKCPALSSAKEDTLRQIRDDAKNEYKEERDKVEELSEKQQDLKQDAADKAAEFSDKENDLLSELSTEESDYQKDLDEKDKEALQQVQEIQTNIKKIQDANRKIQADAKRAMAELAAAKLNARKNCREQSRKDYSERLKLLDEEVARRGGKINGGFEGVQNYEKYRKFLVAKIQNPEPSEYYTLCFSAGDAVDTELQQRNMGQAISMDEFASQIEANNKDAEQLQQQLQQQQQLANQQKIKGYQQHMKKMQMIQQKIASNRQNYQRQQQALQEKMTALEKQISSHQKALEEAEHAKENADARYTCLTRKNLTVSGTDPAGREAYTAVITAVNSVQNACHANPSCCGNATTVSAPPASSSTTNPSTSKKSTVGPQ